jgi:hypothetical protein
LGRCTPKLPHGALRDSLNLPGIDLLGRLSETILFLEPHEPDGFMSGWARKCWRFSNCFDPRQIGLHGAVGPTICQVNQLHPLEAQQFPILLSVELPVTHRSHRASFANKRIPIAIRWERESGLLDMLGRERFSNREAFAMIPCATGTRRDTILEGKAGLRKVAGKYIILCGFPAVAARACMRPVPCAIAHWREGQMGPT